MKKQIRGHSGSPRPVGLALPGVLAGERYYLSEKHNMESHKTSDKLGKISATYITGKWLISTNKKHLDNRNEKIKRPTENGQRDMNSQFIHTKTINGP